MIISIIIIDDVETVHVHDDNDDDDYDYDDYNTHDNTDVYLYFYNCNDTSIDQSIHLSIFSSFYLSLGMYDYIKDAVASGKVLLHA
jgi:hypothetical protein